MLKIYVSSAFLGHFIELPLNSPLNEPQGFGPFVEMVLEHFTGLK